MLAAAASLPDGFRLGEFGAVVDAEHAFGAGLGRHDVEPGLRGDLDDVGEVIFALGVGVADLRRGARSAWLPAIAISPPLQNSILRSPLGSVLVLADGDAACRLSRSGGRSRPDSAVGNPTTTTAAPSASFSRAAESASGLDQRRVAEHHQNVVVAALDRARGPTARRGRCRAAVPGRRFRHPAQTLRRPCEPRPRRGRRPVQARLRQPGLAAAATCATIGRPAISMQHLRLCALHARALAGGEDDGQAASLAHGDFRDRTAGRFAAVLEQRALGWNHILVQDGETARRTAAKGDAVTSVNCLRRSVEASGVRCARQHASGRRQGMARCGDCRCLFDWLEGWVAQSIVPAYPEDSRNVHSGNGAMGLRQ